MVEESLKIKLSELEANINKLSLEGLKAEKEKLWNHYNKLSEIISFKEKMAEHSKRDQ